MVCGKDFLFVYYVIGDDEVGGYVFYKEMLYIVLDVKECYLFFIKEYGKYDFVFFGIFEILIYDVWCVD